MTDEELLREHHHKALAGDWCSRCAGKYPCSTIRLLDKLEAAEAENVRLRAVLEYAKQGIRDTGMDLHGVICQAEDEPWVRGCGASAEMSIDNCPECNAGWKVSYLAVSAALNLEPVVTVLPRTITAGADSLVTERDFTPEPPDATYGQVLGGRGAAD